LVGHEVREAARMNVQAKTSGTRMSDLQRELSDPQRADAVARVRKKMNELGVDYIYLQYISITGRVMGKASPTRHWESLAKKGVQTFMGGVTNVFPDRHGRLIGFPANAHEVIALPDPETFCQLPWNKRMARVFCTLFYMEEDAEKGGMYFDVDCRGALKRNDAAFRAAHSGLHMRVGCEPEMLWLKKPSDPNIPYEGTTKPYAYHIEQFEQLSHVWLKVYEYAIAMGIDIVQGDHEDAPGQVELNFMFDDAVKTADRLSTYRQICAQVARENGLIACFMTKPYMGISANGCHHNLSLWSGGTAEVQELVDGPLPGMDDVFAYTKGGRNELRDERETWKPAEIGRHALGGLLEHLPGMTAIACSTINSYRRLNDTGLWAPLAINWGLQNRSCAVRVSSPDRFEYRPPDSMVNPYLMMSALLTSMDDGLKRRIDPGPPEERNLVEVMRSGESVRRIPMNLYEALEALKSDPVVLASMPGRMHDVYDWYKRDEWDRFIWQSSDWDVATYLDCLP
jgi:glutamine synthetase